jgi:hypothetical protein
MRLRNSCVFSIRERETGILAVLRVNKFLLKKLNSFKDHTKVYK